MSKNKTFRPKNSPFRRDTDERRFSYSFLSLMQEYYQENDLVDPDIFDISWDDLDEISRIATTKNASIDYALAKLDEEMDAEDEEEKLVQTVIMDWVKGGLVSRCHYYSTDPATARLELLSDYIRDSKNTVVKGEIFKLKQLEKKLTELKKNG